MKLQANYHGAWRNVVTIHDGDLSNDQLRQLAPDAPKLRIKDGDQIVWMWDAERGWHRPHWFNREERWEL